MRQQEPLYFRFQERALRKNVRPVVRNVLQVLARFIVSEDRLFECEIALTEACANVATHAYVGQKGEMRLLMALEIEEGVDFQIIDWGSGFVLPDVCILPAKTANSGRGLYIIRKTMDRFWFARENEVNVIYMRKNIGKSLWKV